MARLTRLDAQNANISDLTGLEHATNLKYLYLDRNAITDISAVAGLTNLTRLSLGRNSISDISAVAGLTNLTRLYLDDNSISDISAVAGLTNLTRLYLDDNSISDISAVAGLTNLTRLYLDDNSISDISAVAGLTNLTRLYLDDNSISDILPLFANTGLGAGDAVYVQDNPLSYESAHTYIPALQNRGATVEFDPLFLTEDVNRDGVVDTIDLVLVAAFFGQRTQKEADVNSDGGVNIEDLLLVAGMIGNVEAAPPTSPVVLATFTSSAVEELLTHAQGLDRIDVRLQKGILFFEKLLAALLPKETTLLPNYPNPFNPETWIPYHLASDARVTLTIYDTKGAVVRELDLGHQRAGYYTDRSRAAYWNGRNELGEQVATGVYFYQLQVRSKIKPSSQSYLRKMVILK